MGIAADYPALATALVAKLNSDLNSVGIKAVDGYVGDGDSFPRMSDGTLKPTVIVEVDPPIEPSRRMRGITGPQADQMMVTCAALCIAESSHSVRALCGMVIGSLRGYVPIDGAGVIQFYGAAGGSNTIAPIHPSRYAQTVGFGLSIGAVVVS